MTDSTYTATILDEAGLSARQVADQLGHARISITQDVYLGRRLASRRAAEALERALTEPEDQKGWVKCGNRRGEAPRPKVDMPLTCGDGSRDWTRKIRSGHLSPPC